MLLTPAHIPVGPEHHYGLSGHQDGVENGTGLKWEKGISWALMMCQTIYMEHILSPHSILQRYFTPILWENKLRLREAEYQSWGLNEQKRVITYPRSGNSLAVEWSGLHAFTARVQVQTLVCQKKKKKKPQSYPRSV